MSGTFERASEGESYCMDKLTQPYNMEIYAGLFVVHFERTCKTLSFASNTWSQRLLTFLPCEAAMLW